jgi:hypothetical protein
MIDNQSRMPDPETAERLLANLRRTHLEMQEFNLELEDIAAKLENHNLQQRLKRVRRSLGGLSANLKESESQ